MQGFKDGCRKGHRNASDKRCVNSLLTYYKINSILTSTEGTTMSACRTSLFCPFFCWCSAQIESMIQVLRPCNLFRNSFSADSDLACFYPFPTHGKICGTTIFLQPGKEKRKKEKGKTLLVEIVWRSAFTPNSRWPVYVLGVTKSK